MVTTPGSTPAANAITAVQTQLARNRRPTRTPVPMSHSPLPPQTPSRWYLEMPREAGPVRLSLLEKRVAALGRFVGHVTEPGRLAREHLLADQAVVDQVEGELQHPLSGGAL